MKSLCLWNALKETRDTTIYLKFLGHWSGASILGLVECDWWWKRTIRLFFFSSFLPSLSLFFFFTKGWTRSLPDSFLIFNKRIKRDDQEEAPNQANAINAILSPQCSLTHISNDPPCFSWIIDSPNF